jgi:hypothetical protein
MVTNSNDRPEVPFVRDGEPRIEVAGGVEYRPREVVLALDVIGSSSDRSGDELIEDVRRRAEELLRRVGAGSVSPETFDPEDPDIARARRNGFLRMTWTTGERGPSTSTALTVLMREFGSRSVKPNVVFRVGAVTAAPMHLAPMHLAPMHLAPMHLAPMHLAEADLKAKYGIEPEQLLNSSTARPALPPTDPRRPDGSTSTATVVILDTGFDRTGGAAVAPDRDFPTSDPQVQERPDDNDDQFLDIAAGHMTFIGTMIERASPGARILCCGFGENDGDAEETKVADLLNELYERAGKEDVDMSRLVVNLSFGGYYPDDEVPGMIADEIERFTAAGAVVVASAGNDASCRPKYPAAMSEVIAVGALATCGPAWFSNYGDWVDASAPGEDLVSEFFDGFDGKYEPVDGSAEDFDEFAGWATWSGTSFSTPAVVGALVQIIDLYDCTANEAKRILLGRSGLFRLPQYGVVVNRIF